MPSNETLFVREENEKVNMLALESSREPKFIIQRSKVLCGQSWQR